MLYKLSISYLNINGLHSRLHANRINKLHDESLIKRINSDIICIAETHCSHEESHTIAVDGYTVTPICRPKTNNKGSGGLAVLVKKFLRPGVKFEKIVSSDFIFFKLCKNFFKLKEDIYVCVCLSLTDSNVCL